MILSILTTLKHKIILASRFHLNSIHNVSDQSLKQCLPKSGELFHPDPFKFFNTDRRGFSWTDRVIQHGEIIQLARTLKRCIRLASALAGVFRELRFRWWRPTFRSCSRPISAWWRRGVERSQHSVGAETLAYILERESQVLITDEFSPVIQSPKQPEDPPLVIDIDDPMQKAENFLGKWITKHFWKPEMKILNGIPGGWSQAVSLNYFRNHRKAERGAYHKCGISSSWSTISLFGGCRGIRFIFGRCDVSLQWLVFSMTITLLAGTHVCLRKVNAANIYDYCQTWSDAPCGAPIVMGMIANAEDQDKRVSSDQVQTMTAAAPPPPRWLQGWRKWVFRWRAFSGRQKLWTFGCQCLAGRMEWIES